MKCFIWGIHNISFRAAESKEKAAKHSIFVAKHSDNQFIYHNNKWQIFSSYDSFQNRKPSRNWLLRNIPDLDYKHIEYFSHEFYQKYWVIELQ